MKSKNTILLCSALTMCIGLNLNLIAQNIRSSDLKTSVDVKEAYALLSQGALLLDVREPAEIEEVGYNVDEIITIPLGDLKNNLSLVPVNKQVILACKSGKRSEQAYAILHDNGYTNISQMAGGMIAWEEAGLPVSKIGEAGSKGTKSACCADPNSKNCNPDGTCKDASKASTKVCCAGESNAKKKKGKACCSPK